MKISNFLKKETIVESTVVMTVLSLLQKVIQVVRGAVFARVLGTASFGVFSLALLLLPLLVTVAKLGLPSSFERYVPQYEQKGNLREFFRRSYFITFGAGLVITFICLLFSGQISELIYSSKEYKTIIILCVLTILPYVFYENLLYSFNGLRIFKIGALLTFSQFLLFTVLAIPMLLYYRTVESTVLSNLISFLIVALIFGYIFWNYILDKPSQSVTIREGDFYKKIFSYSSWYILGPVIATLSMYVDRWMLSWMSGLDKTGIYSVASNFTGFIFIFGTTIGSVLLPNLSNMWEADHKDRAMHLLNFVLKLNTLVLLGYAIVIMFVRRQIISLIYGDAYLDGAAIVGILFIFWIFNSMFWIIKNYAGLIEKPYLPFVGSTIALVINILLNFILIPYYGMLGAALATLISYGIGLIVVFYFSYKYGMHIESRTVFICIMPFILILNKILLMVFSILVIVMIMKTDLVFTKEEKSYLRENIIKLLSMALKTTN